MEENNQKQGNKNLGFISLACVGIGWFAFGLPLSIAAIVFGALGAKTAVGKIGIVLGIIELVLMLSYFGA